MYKLKFETSGFNFFGSATGEEGVALFKEKHPDIVMVDLMLENKAEGGVLDGYETIRQLRTLDADVKICALTNLDQEKNVQDARAVGADAYLVKSDVTPSELVAKTHDILAGKDIGLADRRE